MVTLITIPIAPSQEILNQKTVIDNVEYFNHQFIQYYGLEGKSKPVSVPVWFYDKYVQLSKENAKELKSIKAGEFVSVIRDRSNNILAMSYVLTDMKVLSDLAKYTGVESVSSYIQTRREYINRTERSMYITTRQGVVLYCKPTQSTGTKDFIIRETWDFATHDQATVSHRCMSEMDEDLQTPLIKLVIASLAAIIKHPLPGSMAHSGYRVVVDYIHHSDTFAHGKTIYDPNTSLLLGTTLTERENAEHEIAHAEACLDLHSVIMESQSAKSCHTLLVRINGSDTKDYYYKAFGRVHKVTSATTDELGIEIIDGIGTGETLKDYVELWSNRPSATRSRGDGWIDDKSKSYDETYLQYRIGLTEAIKIFGLYDTPTLANHSGDPEKVDTLNMMLSIKQLNNDKAESEREIAALKLQQAQEGGRMSAQEHDQRMQAQSEKYTLELKELEDKRLRDLADAEVKRKREKDDADAKSQRDKEDYERRLAEEKQKYELNAKREEALHKNTIQTETKKTWGEWAKLVGVVVTTTAVVAAAIIKLAPIVTASSLVKGAVSFLFGLW